MNRTDRLVAMVLHLQGRRVVRAGGLLVTHEGLCEYELVDLDGHYGREARFNDT